MKHFFTFGFVVLAAYAALFVWNAELHNRIGSAGTYWVHQTFYSSFLIHFFIATAYLIPFSKSTISKQSLSPKWLLLFRLIVSQILLYEYARFLFLHSNFFSSWFAFSVFGIATLPILAAFIIYFISNRYLIPLKRLQIVLTALALYGIFGLSLLAVDTLNYYGRGSGFRDAVKMGFPQAISIIVLYLVGLISSTKLLKSTSSKTVFNDDLLDA